MKLQTSSHVRRSCSGRCPHLPRGRSRSLFARSVAGVSDDCALSCNKTNLFLTSNAAGPKCPIDSASNLNHTFRHEAPSASPPSFASRMEEFS